MHISYADEVYLKNSDKISGKIVEETQESLRLETAAMGTISIKKPLVKNITYSEKTPKHAKEPAKKTEEEISATQDSRITWKREVSLGYNRVTGNTRESRLSGSFLINRNNFHVDEWTFKGNIFYSSAKRKMDSQNWYSSGRYAYSFGSSKMWYNFYNIEADHDRFADIDYRIVPSSGIGYWFSDTPEFKLMAEAGAGYEYTVFRSDIKNSEQWVLIPRVYLEKKISQNSVIRQDLFYYPHFESFGKYRILSKTSLDVTINKKFTIRLTLTDSYNSDPPEDIKNNDLRLTSSLVYSF